jgi:UV excision repair protein RAD23
MKITVKTLQQKVFQIDAESSETVGDLKQKILSSQGHAVESQKLIYSGKVLTDDKTVESCEIKEKDFLVLMVSKPKPTPTPALIAAPTPATASSSTPAAIPAAPTPAPPAPITSAPAASTPSAAAARTPATSAAPVTQPAFGDMSTFLTGSALEVQINNMVEMGFPREEALRAMRASFNNPDRAVEYLMTGIPEYLLAEQVQPSAPAPTTAAPQAVVPAAPAPAPAPATGQPQNLFQLAQQQHQGGGALGGGAAGAVGGIDIDALRDNPQMAQLRQLVRQNPALLQPLIQQLSQANPQFAHILEQNPEALMDLLAAEGGVEGEGVAMPPTVVNVTEEERAAIERLEALGFPRQAVVEAYFACDKNEELAANFLFDQGGED